MSGSPAPSQIIDALLLLGAPGAYVDTDHCRVRDGVFGDPCPPRRGRHGRAEIRLGPGDGVTDQVGGLDESVDAALGVKARVGGAAIDLHEVPRGALARGFELPLDGGLEHEHRVSVTGGVLDHSPRGLGADLLIRGEEHAHAVIGPDTEQSDGTDGLDDADLHIEHPGTPHAVAIDCPRDPRQGADRPHRVEVPEQEHAGILRPPAQDRLAPVLRDARRAAEPRLDQGAGRGQTGAACLEVG